MRFNPPPGWPTPPAGWTPPPGWKPDPAWPAPPAGWPLWLPDGDQHPGAPTPDVPAPATPPPAPVSPVTAPAPPGTASVTGSADTAALIARIQQLEGQLAQLSDSSVADLNDQRVLQEVGIYRYHHPLENSVQYRDRLAALDVQIKQHVQANTAIQAAELFTFDNSLAKGRRMVGDLSKLMLRAYNAEADICVRSLRAGNVQAAKKRLDTAVQSIQRLGTVMEMRVNPDFHQLRIEELELTADFQMMVQQERERAREERAELREQAPRRAGTGRRTGTAGQGTSPLPQHQTSTAGPRRHRRRRRTRRAPRPDRPIHRPQRLPGREHPRRLRLRHLQRRRVRPQRRQDRHDQATRTPRPDP